MKGFREYWEDLNNWIFSELWRAIVIALLGLVIFSAGFDLAFFMPGRMRQAAISEAQVAIDELTIEYQRFTARHEQESSWFQPVYTDKLGSTLSLASSNGNQAAILLQSAQEERGYRESIKLSHQSVDLVTTTQALLAEMEAGLNTNQQLKDSVRLNLVSVNQGITDSNANYSEVSSRFTGKRDNFLTRYTDELEIKLLSANTKVGEAQQLWDAASLIMPPDGDITSTGDPVTAQANLDSAKATIDEINTLASTVTSRLEYLSMADVKAAPTANEAQQAYTDANGYVNSVHDSKGYWLQDAFISLQQAKEWLDRCLTALGTIVERSIVDKPEAYESGLTSIDFSNTSVSQTDTQIANYNAAVADIATINRRISEISSLITSARNAKATLNSYHATSTWSDVSSNITTIEGLISDSQAKANEAQENLSLTVQRFDYAATLASTGANQLDQVQLLAQQLVDRANALEGYRSVFNSKYGYAQGVINGESSQISMYGSYDWGAQSDYDSAKSLLSQAQSDANAGLYQSACDKADLAASRASGTGNRAENAYDDYQRRQAEAEEAARRAAEEAARQSSQDDYDYGGSSNWDSGSDWDSDSDWGSSSSDSDWGSDWGSDSDYGSDYGSDSDW